MKGALNGTTDLYKQDSIEGARKGQTGSYKPMLLQLGPYCSDTGGLQMALSHTLLGSLGRIVHS
jgi:hypothetical protein